MVIKMSTEIRKELDRLFFEVDELRQISEFKRISPDLKLKRYHALLNRISNCPMADFTPDELISSLKRKEY